MDGKRVQVPYSAEIALRGIILSKSLLGNLHSLILSAYRRIRSSAKSLSDMAKILLSYKDARTTENPDMEGLVNELGARDESSEYPHNTIDVASE